MAKVPGFAKALPAAGAIVEMDNWDSHSLLSKGRILPCQRG